MNGRLIPPLSHSARERHLGLHVNGLLMLSDLKQSCNMSTNYTEALHHKSSWRSVRPFWNDNVCTNREMDKTISIGSAGLRTPSKVTSSCVFLNVWFHSVQWDFSQEAVHKRSSSIHPYSSHIYFQRFLTFFYGSLGECYIVYENRSIKMEHGRMRTRLLKCSQT